MVVLVAVMTFSFRMMLVFDCYRERSTSARTVDKRASRLGRDTMETNHVSQGDCEVGGVSSDEGPCDSLTSLASIPDGT